ncbi:hypothetical protein [Chitinophaga defluvii]|uniref:Transposase n=1 Tax=Chitinophaga defluvii TaxID=3163343 RepID=A0ABV2T6Q2_9BACT
MRWQQAVKPQICKAFSLQECAKAFLKSSSTWERLKDCIVPAIGKMNGCQTTGFLAFISELDGFAG